jgi:diguanylate cyclase (GGDEF)-like protein
LLTNSAVSSAARGDIPEPYTYLKTVKACSFRHPMRTCEMLRVPTKAFHPTDRVSHFVATLLAVGATGAVIAGLLAWSTLQADRVALDRQEKLASVVLAQSIARLPHDQESVTVWDEALRQVRAGVEPEWFDANLGIWMHSYFGHDRAYVLNAQDQAVYAMVEGRRAEPSSFSRIEATVRPLVDELRHMLAASSPPDLDSTVLSPGVTDLQVVDNHPAIVSVKPIVSDSGKIEQQAGTQFVHVAVRYLDGNFLDGLARNYLFTGARFAWSDDRQRGEALYSLKTGAGSTIGNFIWRPYMPGSLVLADTAPVLGIVIVAIAMIFMLLLGRLRGSARALQASEAQAQHLAFHDTLTGLPNRALFNDRLDRALAEVRRSDRQLALLYLDLDRFKQVNDTLGHPAGDELIREFGRRIVEVVRETDTVARLGGDEFAIIQAGLQSPADLEKLCRRIEVAVSRPFALLETQAFVGISIGIALAPANAIDRTELTRKADIALYHAKANGRGRWVVFSEEMDKTAQRRRAVERDLREALRAGNQLKVLYQPLFSSRHATLTGLEALVRWDHPRHGRMGPATFVPIAEESGLIDRLGDWVLRTACLAATAWHGKTISVNISPVQLRNPHFARRVLDIVQETGLDPRRLQLEITETALLENIELSQPIVAALRREGVRIALDDFGTGYSSLSHLRQFEVDRVKIDRSFVQGLDQSDAIIQAIVDLARGTGLEITAEGVETSEQSEYLSRIGCQELQGFLFGRPMPITDIDTLLGVDAASARAPSTERTAA